jgi:hypothetical protein
MATQILTHPQLATPLARLKAGYTIFGWDHGLYLVGVATRKLQDYQNNRSVGYANVLSAIYEVGEVWIQ